MNVVSDQYFGRCLVDPIFFSNRDLSDTNCELCFIPRSSCAEGPNGGSSVALLYRVKKRIEQCGLWL